MVNHIKKKEQKILYIMILSTFIGISMLFFIFKFLNDRFDTSDKAWLSALSEHQQSLINEGFNNAQSTILSLENTILTLESREEKNNYLKEQNKFLGFDDLYFISTHEKQNIYSFNKKNITALAKNKVIVSYPFISETTGNYVVSLKKPVIQNEKTIGIITANYSIETIIRHLKEELAPYGYGIITAGVGDELIVTDPNYTPLLEMVDAITAIGLTVDDIKNDLKERKSNLKFFTIDSIPRVGSYMPLSVSDWTLAIIVEKNKISSDIKLLTKFLVISVFLLFLGFVFFFLYSKKKKIQVEKIAYYDELTGLPTLVKLKKEISEIIETNPNAQYVMVKFDIKNFKLINEIYSYEVGNQVLSAFSQTASIVPEKTFRIGRVGVDEFIMFSGNGFLEQLESLTPHYEGYFREALPMLKGYHLTFRYGRYITEPGETNVDEMIAKTIFAHSMSKRKKGNGIWDYDAEYKSQLLKHAEVINKMDKALKNQEFQPYLQPKFRLSDNKLIGAEALVRWIEKDGKIIYPDEFIPVFEANGFIIEIDKHILKTVCTLLKEWLDKGYDCVPIAVNFSRIHLLNSDFVTDIIDIVDNYGIPHEYIEIELTETTILENESNLEKLLSDLQSAKFSVSIDDFGAGHSSLGMLKNYKADTIKLDRSFLMKRNQLGDIVIDGIVKLAHSINLRTVAEGVEEEEQVEFLREINCEYGQGYYFAKPMPVEEFIKKYLVKNSLS